MSSNRERALALLKELYKGYPDALEILVTHSIAVTNFALALAKQFTTVDCELVERAALLHDCGIFCTHAPNIGCHGKAPYLTHGILGAEILREHGFEQEADICETHVGVGITAAMIRVQNLPLPHRDFIPHTLEAKIIAYADCFFSKRPGLLTNQKSFGQVLQEVARFGDEPKNTFILWHEELNPLS